MDFTLTDGQKKLVSAFRTFGADTFTPERVAKWCRDQGLPDTVMKEFVDLYYETAEPDIAPDLAHSLLSQVLIVEELSRCAGTTLPFQNDLFNLQIMSGFAGAAEAASIAEDYRADGRLMFALAISEPDGGSDTMAMKTSCQTVDGRLLLNGRKSYVNNGEYAPYILVAAIDKDAGDTGRYPSLSFWLVPRNVPGINAVPISKIGQSMLPFALISFDDVELSPEWRLDASEGGVPAAVPSAGIRARASVRLQLGHGPGGHGRRGGPRALPQGLRRAGGALPADMRPFSPIWKCACATCAPWCTARAWSIDAADETERLDVALMKRYVPEASVQVASDAMQILGGLGYTEGSRVSRIWEDCRGNQIAEGTDQVMVYIAAPLIMEHYRSF